MIKIKKFLEKTSALIGMFLLIGVASSQAAVLTVDTTADNGFGSLRQAIIDANTNAEANTVNFAIPTTDPNFNSVNNRFTITLLSQLPNLPLAPLSINNNQVQGVTVKGDDSFRIFTLVDSAVVILKNLTISDGFSSDGVGGGIFMGDSSTLNLEGSVVRDNNVKGIGGGIYMSNSATLSVINSTLTNNSANSGGGIFINNSGTLNISNSVINGNTAAGGDGGGIFNGVSGTVNAVNLTVDGNVAGNNGGGIYNVATVTLTSNTVSNNSAGSGGGGIYNNFTATLNNSIIAQNTAADGSDLLGRGSLGNVYTGTYNLIGNADGCEGLDTDVTNLRGSTLTPLIPMLGPLQNNGGTTFTRALLNGSPAVDKGSSPGLITDQRGRVRPYDDPLISNASDGADIGAFEANFAPTATSFSISGRVIMPGAYGSVNALVVLTDSRGSSQTALTGKFGSFKFSDLVIGEVYYLRISSRHYVYLPQVIVGNGDLSALTFAPIQ